MAKVQTPKRGEIWLVDFDPGVGAELRKFRPAVVVSLDTIGRLPLSLVVPITDWKPQYANYPWFVHLTATWRDPEVWSKANPANYPWFVHLTATAANGLTKDSGADAFQTNNAVQVRLEQT